MLNYAFGNKYGRKMDFVAEQPKMWVRSDEYMNKHIGVFEDGKLVSVLGIYPLPVKILGKDFLFMTAVRKIGYLRIRTGDVDNHNPTPDTQPHEEEEYHLPDADLPAKEKAYLLHRIALKE